jgi:hypothetical protein
LVGLDGRDQVPVTFMFKIASHPTHMKSFGWQNI